MEQRLHRIQVATRGRGPVEVTDQVVRWVTEQGIGTGLLTVWWGEFREFGATRPRSRPRGLQRGKWLPGLADSTPGVTRCGVVLAAEPNVVCAVCAAHPRTGRASGDRTAGAHRAHPHTARSAPRRRWARR